MTDLTGICPVCNETCARVFASANLDYPDGTEESIAMGGGGLNCTGCGYNGYTPEVEKMLDELLRTNWAPFGLIPPRDPHHQCVVCHEPLSPRSKKAVRIGMWLGAHKHCYQKWRDDMAHQPPPEPFASPPTLWQRIWRVLGPTTSKS